MYITAGDVFAIAAMGAAGFLQGIAGIGFGLIALSFISLVLPVKTASVALVFGSLAVNVLIVFQLRRYFQWVRVVPLLPVALCAIPFGVFFFSFAQSAVLNGALGVLLIAAVLQKFLPSIAGKRWHPIFVGIPTGIVSGFLSGALGTGGPPAAAYLSSQALSRFEYAVSIQFILGVSALVRLLFLAGNGYFSTTMLLFNLGGPVSALLGAWCGNRLMGRISDKAVRRMVIILLTCLGVKYIAGIFL